MGFPDDILIVCLTLFSLECVGVSEYNGLKKRIVQVDLEGVWLCVQIVVFISCTTQYFDFLWI